MGSSEGLTTTGRFVPYQCCATRTAAVIALGKQYPRSRWLLLTVGAQDPSNDLATIAIQAPAAQLHPAALGDAGTLHVGDPVFAIGNPLGYQGTLTEGIISGLDRTFDDGRARQ